MAFIPITTGEVIHRATEMLQSGKYVLLSASTIDQLIRDTDLETVNSGARVNRFPLPIDADTGNKALSECRFVSLQTLKKVREDIPTMGNLESEDLLISKDLVKDDGSFSLDASLLRKAIFVAKTVFTSTDKKRLAFKNDSLIRFQEMGSYSLNRAIVWYHTFQEPGKTIIYSISKEK